MNIQYLKWATCLSAGEKPFKCPIEGCGRSFTTSNIRKVHIRTHTGERPYYCSEPSCGRSFASATNYKNHMRIHTGQSQSPDLLAPKRLPALDLHWPLAPSRRWEAVRMHCARLREALHRVLQPVQAPCGPHAVQAVQLQPLRQDLQADLHAGHAQTHHPQRHRAHRGGAGSLFRAPSRSVQTW